MNRNITIAIGGLRTGKSTHARNTGSFEIHHVGAKSLTLEAIENAPKDAPVQVSMLARDEALILNIRELYESETIYFE